MGIYDSLICSVPLPGDPPEFVRGPGHQFQTKDLECSLSTYEIRADSRLWNVRADLAIEHFTGTVDFYADNGAAFGPTGVYTRGGEDNESVEYRATFVDGLLKGIAETRRARVPALPISRLHESQTPPTEADVAGWLEREQESLVGRTMYLLWGGREPTEGEVVTVVFEGPHEWVLSKPDGHLEVFDRRGRGRILWDSPADALEANRERAADQAAERAEYDELLASRAAKQEP